MLRIRGHWRLLTWDQRSRLIGRGFAFAWYFFYVLAVYSLYQQPGPGFAIRALTIGAVAFTAVYAWYYLRGLDQGEPAGWTAVSALSVISVTTAFVAAGSYDLSYGFGWMTDFIYVIVIAGFCFRTRPALGVIVAAAALTGAAGFIATRAPIVLLTVGGEFILIGVSAMAFSRLSSTFQELRTAREELARLAVAEERLRFARDLHDLLGHSLSVIVLKAELLDRLMPEDAPPRVKREAAEIEKVARAALSEVREAVTGYRQATVASELGNAAAILEAAGIAFRRDNTAGELPPAAESVLAWAVREGVTNVIRHSGARSCEVSIERRRDGVRLDVVDDGAGVPAVEGGSGLAGLRERVTVVGGTVEAAALPREGFRLRVTLPLDGGVRVRVLTGGA